MRNRAAAVAVSPNTACVGVNGCNWVSGGGRLRRGLDVFTRQVVGRSVAGTGAGGLPACSLKSS